MVGDALAVDSLGRAEAAVDGVADEVVSAAPRLNATPAEGLLVRLSTMNTAPRARRINMNDVRARPAR